MSSPPTDGAAPTPQDRKRKLSLTKDAASPQSSPILKHTRNTSKVNGPRALDSLVEASTANTQVIAQQTSAPASNLQAAVAANGDAQMLDSDNDDAAEDDSDPESVESDSSSVLESAVYQIELDPYVYDNHDDAYTADEAKQMRAHLKEVGIEKFVDETMDVSHRKLGTVFGMDPKLPIDDELFTKLLFMAMVRSYRKREKLAAYNTLKDAADLISTCKSIMIITGAGISTSLGIPDFRSRNTGFYDRLREMGYEDAEQVFDIDNFDHDPNIFYSLAGQILPDQTRFTPTHAFIKLLQDKNKLQTNYTQNIDNLEAAAGIDKAKLIQCHGSFATASCRKCRHQVLGETIFDNIRNGKVAECQNCIDIITETGAAPVLPVSSSQPPKKLSKKTNATAFSSGSSSDVDDDIPTPGVMKPDITFFGEALPQTFFQRFTSVDANPEISSLDLVIVIGTSLSVAPVSEMVNYVPACVPQIYISREPVKERGFDVQLLGECDVICWELARMAGWHGQLVHEMVPSEGWEVGVKEFEEGSGSRGLWKVEGVKVEGKLEKDEQKFKFESAKTPDPRVAPPKTNESWPEEVFAGHTKAPVNHRNGPSTTDSCPEAVSRAAFAAAGDTDAGVDGLSPVLAPAQAEGGDEDIKVKMEAVAEGLA